MALGAALAALAGPAGALAHTDAQTAGGFGRAADPADVTQALAPAVAVSPTTSTAGSDGVGTVTVLALAGGTLLVGAAGGFGGGRIVTRRHAVRA
jgi:hypothetical protein